MFSVEVRYRVYTLETCYLDFIRNSRKRINKIDFFNTAESEKWFREVALVLIRAPKLSVIAVGGPHMSPECIPFAFCIAQNNFNVTTFKISDVEDPYTPIIKLVRENRTNISRIECDQAWGNPQKAFELMDALKTNNTVTVIAIRFVALGLQFLEKINEMLSYNSTVTRFVGVRFPQCTNPISAKLDRNVALSKSLFEKLQFFEPIRQELENCKRIATTELFSIPCPKYICL